MRMRFLRFYAGNHQDTALHFVEQVPRLRQNRTVGSSQSAHLVCKIMAFRNQKSSTALATSEVNLTGPRARKRATSTSKMGRVSVLPVRGGPAENSRFHGHTIALYRYSMI